MYRIVLRHVGGSKHEQVEEFSLDQARDLIIGRDPAAQVRFDPTRDDLVGKQHARILQDAGNPLQFSIVDMNSRNGTYVNQQRVQGTTTISSGDMVQLGAGGPEFRFEIDPLPPPLVPATREAVNRSVVDGAAAMPKTRAGATAAAGAAIAGSGSTKTVIGMKTLEHRLNEAQRETRRTLSVSLAAVAVVVLAVAGLSAWQWQKLGHAPAPAPITMTVPPPGTGAWDTTKTAAAFAESTVLVDFGWKLTSQTGEQMYQRYVRNGDRAHPAWLPVFVLQADRTFAPDLTPDQGQELQNTPIGCGGAGSGFVVTTDGFIMTNRHVAANWETRYSCFPATGPAWVQEPGKVDLTPVADIRALRLDWVPGADTRKVAGKTFQGENIHLDVLFKLNKLGFPATVARVSDRADVALIKINSPQPVKKVEMLNNYDSIAVGNSVVVMGYPGISPNVYVSTQSVDPFRRPGRLTAIPDPTVTPGSVGRIIRDRMKAMPGTFDYASSFGDAYQLTVNATGAGNSGGPVLDDQGHVIGLFTSASAQITFAVPIRYGLELMGTSAAVDSGVIQ